MALKRKLQQFSRPTTDICPMLEMYFHCNDLVEYDYKSGVFKLEENGILTADSYFNSFSYSKWDKYTCISSIDLEVTIKGNATLYLIRSILCGETVLDSIVDSISINTCDITTETLHFDFSKEQFEGIAYLKIVAKEETEFYGACYYANTDAEPKKPNMAIIMCTFKRERYLYNNINAIKRFRNQESLDTEFELFVIDNGKTLDKKFFGENFLHLIPNKNTGGAGGFTRGIIEALEKNTFTHIILMDDDVLFDPDILKRTSAFLAFIKTRYDNYFLGGATLRMDIQNIQLESGAIWNNNILINLKRGLQLDQKFSLLSNEIEESKSYTSWVYCCIPCTAFDKNDLPLPLFVRGDDMEFGLRHRQGIISLNGIGVWHAPVDGRYSYSMNYYITRNTLVLNALYDNHYTPHKAVKQLMGDIKREISFFRYENVDLLLQAYEDFLGGVDFFLRTDGEEHHQKIIKICPQLYSYEELEKQGYPFSLLKYYSALGEGESLGIKRVIRKLSLNGYLLPGFLKKRGSLENFGVTDLFYAKINNFYRRNCLVQIDSFGKRGVITKRSFTKAVNRFLKSIWMVLRLRLGAYKRAVNSYQTNISKLHTLSFWKSYLDIDRGNN